MITTHQDYISAIQRGLDDKPSSLFISTFNLQTGVSSRGTAYASPTFLLLQRIQASVRDPRLLVGLPTQGDCIQRCQAAAEYWPKLRVRTLYDLHLKCWIFKYKGDTRALVGGRNLGDSQWRDVSWWLNGKQSKELLGYYADLWSEAKPVTIDTTPHIEVIR
jgi:hypothetical protein